MNDPFIKLEQIFHTSDIVTETHLISLFDSAGIPDETCWRAVYRAIFDHNVDTGSQSDLGRSMGKAQLEPVMEEAVQIARNHNYTEKALLSLIKGYNTTTFSVYDNHLIDVIQELDRLSLMFKSMTLNSQSRVKNLQTDTLTTMDSDLTIADKIKLVKSKFKKTINLFQKDLVKLDRMTHTDHLTSLYNRRFFDDQLETEVTQALAEKTWLNLLMLDIDDFKRFNDRYGHLVGDQALKTIAKNIQLTCRDEAGSFGIPFYPTRYGGEEFAIIIPAVDKSQAINIADLISRKIRDYMFVIRNKEGHIKYKDLSLTVSIGVAELNHGLEKEAAVKDLIKKADSAMYRAKKDGKNCVRES